MLIEKSQKLIKLSQQKTKIQNYINNRAGFSSRNQQIAKLLQQVTELVQSLRLFRNHGLIAGDCDPNVERILELVQFSLSKYQEKNEWILDNNNFNATNFQRDINRITTKLEKQLLQSWQNYLNRKLPRTNQELLNLLAKIKEFQPTIEKFRSLESQLKSEQLPKYQEQLNYIESLVEQLNKTWNTLNAENVPDEVLNFLKAAGNNRGASLNLLTPTVRTWIEIHQLSNTLRIRLS